MDKLLFKALTDSQVMSLSQRLIDNFGVEAVIFTSQNIIKKYTDNTENQVNIRDTYTRIIKHINENY